MYLSYVQLNPHRRATRDLLASAHRIHAEVLSAFPDATPTPDGRILWRLDANGHELRLYVVSPRRPDFTKTIEDAGWPTLVDTWQVRPYDALLDSLAAGQRYRFRLTANPTRNIPQKEDGVRGKVRGHVTPEHQAAWLRARAESLGFALAADDSGREELMVTANRSISFARRETRVTLRVATFEGVLTVVDPERFRRALSHGIGRAKGYGCGLLTIAPIG